MRFIITKVSRFLAALLGVCLLALPLGALADGAVVIPPERDQELKDHLQAAIDDILNTETTIVHSNEYIPGETYSGRAFYVSSSTGNDNNDGLTPETAWASLNHACYGSFGGNVPEFGDAVFFKRGDIFRFTENELGMEMKIPGVTYSAYGEGPKPIITPSPENGTGAEKWKLYYSDDTGMKIWEFYRPMQDMACVVLNNEIIVRRVFETWTPETGYISCTNENYLFESDYGVTLLDRLYAPEEALTEDKTFICRPGVIDPANGVNLGAPGSHLYNPDGVGPLYVRCDAGNPGELFASIEFARRWMQSSVWLRASDITLDNLSFRYNGIAEIKNGLMEGYEMMRGTVIQNCEFAFGGGAVAFYEILSPSGENKVIAQADGIYTVVSDATIRHNYFHDRREGSVSFECPLDKPTRFGGYYHVLDNVMVNTMGIRMDTTSEALKYLDEAIIEGNQIWYTGALDDGGYVYTEGGLFLQTQFFDKFAIRNNVFYCTEHGHPNALFNTFCYRGDLLANDIDFANNVYVQHDGGEFAWFLAHGEGWSINDPDLKDKAALFLGDATSEFYILPDSPAE